MSLSEHTVQDHLKSIFAKTVDAQPTRPGGDRPRRLSSERTSASVQRSAGLPASQGATTGDHWLDRAHLPPIEPKHSVRYASDVAAVRPKKDADTVAASASPAANQVGVSAASSGVRPVRFASAGPRQPGE